MKLEVTHHAIEEAIKDFRVDRRVAEDWIRSNFRKARFIADIISNEGEPRRLFGFQRISFIASPDRDVIITVYPRHHAVNEIQSKVTELVERELRKAQQAVKSAERRVAIEKARLKLDIAEANFRMTITPSRRVIEANKAKIDEYKRKITELDEELLRAKKEMSAVAKSVVAYV